MSNQGHTTFHSAQSMPEGSEQQVPGGDGTVARKLGFCLHKSS